MLVPAKAVTGTNGRGRMCVFRVVVGLTAELRIRFSAGEGDLRNITSPEIKERSQIFEATVYTCRHHSSMEPSASESLATRLRARHLPRHDGQKRFGSHLHLPPKDLLMHQQDID